MQRTEDDRLCFKTPPLMKNSSFYVYHLWSFLIIQYWYWGCLLSSWVTHDDILCFIFGRGKFEVDSGHELDELEQDQNDEEGDRRRDDDQWWFWSQYSGWIFPNIGAAPPLSSWHQSILLVSLVTKAANEHSQSLKLYNHVEGPCQGLLLVETGYCQCFHILELKNTMITWALTNSW